jgi:hypothetical protein
MVRPDARASDDRDRLEALAVFLPAFESPGFEIGTWTPAWTRADGVIAMAYFTLSDVGESFHRAAASNGWVDPAVDWVAWSQSEDAHRFRDDPSSVADATADDLRRLLTAVIRAERFGDGEIEAAWRSGLLTAIVRRAAILARADDADLTVRRTT